MTSTTKRPSAAAGRAELADAGLLLILGTTALLGLRTTFADWRFLAVGVTGLLIGTLIAFLATRLRIPILLMALLVVVGYFLFGGIAVNPSGLLGGVVPSLDSFRSLATTTVTAWKDLLTTLPPVDNDNGFLVIPYALGTLSGSIGYTIARQTRPVLSVALVPVALLIAVSLLGAQSTFMLLGQGLVFAIAIIGWLAVRAGRRSTTISTRARKLTQLASAGAVLAVAAGITAALMPVIEQPQAERTVLRSYIEPPFDVSALPSPLVGFRKYTADANLLHDQTLLTVTGLPEGTMIRIATLDGYDGHVWGARGTSAYAAGGTSVGTFQSIGQRVADVVDGQRVTAQVTVSPAYAASADLNAWVPVPGPLSAIAFDGPNAAANRTHVRYNTTTFSLVVPTRIRAEDTFQVESTVAATEVPADPQPGDPLGLDPSTYSFVTAFANKWGGSSESSYDKAMAIADYLRTNGAYSDGGPGETMFLPGHSIGRLSTMLNGSQIVGDEEQYGALFALMSNAVGMPARVVFGAVPSDTGVVKGQDVRVWVELHLADGSWLTVPTETYMPDTSKKPNELEPQTIQDTNAAVVPPPNTIRPPSTLDDLQHNEASSTRSATPDTWELPAWLALLIRWVGIPIAIVGALLAIILGAKAVRRRRRRRHGPPQQRISAGWRELLDRARDLGFGVPTGITRREQARLVPELDIAGYAERANAATFGLSDPPEEVAAQFWTDLNTHRKRIGRTVSPLRRLKAALSIATFLPKRDKPVTPPADLSPAPVTEVADR